MEAFGKFRISGEVRQVLDVIIRKTYGFNKKKDKISTSQFEIHTGLDKKTIHRARRKLLEMNLITIYKNEDSQILSYSFQKDYNKWKQSPKMNTVPKFAPKQSLNLRQTVPNIATHNNNTTKDSITKDNIMPSATLKVAFDEILKDGFNIYALLNKLKKSSKVGAEVPEKVLLKVCKSYWKNKPDIKSAWAWFCKAIPQEYMKYNAYLHEKESENADKRGAVAPCISEIIKGIGNVQGKK